MREAISMTHDEGGNQHALRGIPHLHTAAAEAICRLRAKRASLKSSALRSALASEARRVGAVLKRDRSRVVVSTCLLVLMCDRPPASDKCTVSDGFVASMHAFPSTARRSSRRSLLLVGLPSATLPSATLPSAALPSAAAPSAALRTGGCPVRRGLERREERGVERREERGVERREEASVAPATARAS